MKKRFFVALSIVILFIFINFLSFLAMSGINSPKSITLSEKISLISSNPSILLNPFFTLFAVFYLMGSNPIIFFFVIIMVVALYYLYDNLIRNKKKEAVPEILSVDKKELSIDENFTESNDLRIEFSEDGSGVENKNDSSGVLKIIILTVVILVTVMYLYVLTADFGPGEGVGLGMLLMPFIPFIFIFFPIYFIVLALRYSREKGKMHILDKITFYVLLFGIGSFFLMAINSIL